ncbi:N-acetylmuramoyl-L-alanine amidase [Beijerinckia indica subsp. indica ATCC 9039]|uniref:N-acetylmuramoyl-L-alanine amidase n=2 Tax=Beijerinckia TaxID=532 RepID=B2IHZ9_BEII9|nr:N-acetylmuramoyl-L-alanine amidase [Beijerinckia indica subsp. indica ATCC 9039]
MSGVRGPMMFWDWNGHPVRASLDRFFSLLQGFSKPGRAWAAWLFFIFMSPVSSFAAEQAPVQASAAWLETRGEGSRLVFDLSAPVEVKAMVLSAPDRVVIDLPAVDFMFAPPTFAPAPAALARHRRGRHASTAQTVAPSGLIAAYRFGSFAPGRSRIVIDLKEPARVIRAGMEAAQDTSSSGRARLVIVLAATDRASFRAAAQNGRQEVALASAQAPAALPDNAPMIAPKPGPNVDRPVIVIDPGHGGVDSGAMAGTLVEKNLVRDFAKSLADKLNASRRYQIIMTREDDIFIPLGERVKIAQAHHADLFISIHADILSETADVGGATVYTVSDKASDAEAARLADKENQADLVGGLESKEETPEITDILFDLTRRETRAYSHVFARTLVDYWKVVGRLNKNPQRSAGFRVLKAPDVPSVLLELGYLSNENDHAALASPEWRGKVVTKVAEAVDRFFAARGPTQVQGQFPGPGQFQGETQARARGHDSASILRGTATTDLAHDAH